MKKMYMRSTIVAFAFVASIAIVDVIFPNANLQRSIGRFNSDLGVFHYAILAFFWPLIILTLANFVVSWHWFLVSTSITTVMFVFCVLPGRHGDELWFFGVGLGAYESATALGLGLVLSLLIALIVKHSV